MPSQSHTIFGGGGAYSLHLGKKMSQKQIKSALGRNKNAPQCKKGVGRSPGAGGYAALQNRGRLPRRVYTAVQEGVRPNAGGMP